MHTSTRLGLDIPDGTDAVSAYPTDSAQSLGILDKAALYTTGTVSARPAVGSVPAGSFYYATDTALWYASNGTTWNTIVEAGGSVGALTVVGHTSTATAVAGQSIDAQTGPWTLTLPAPTNGAVVQVITPFGVSGTAPITVQAGSGSIFGLGVSGSSFLLGTNGANATLIADGSNWVISSGQQDTGWITATLQSSWSASASPYSVPGYRKIGDWVWLRGRVTGGTPSQPILTLPTGYRPAGFLSGFTFPVAGTENDIAISNSTGTVVPDGNGPYSLESISFSTT